MKTFILYASAGAGHRKAAEALFEAAKTAGKEREVEIFDVLDYTNAFFKWSYNAIYMFAIKYVPYLWGLFYYILDFKPVYLLALPFRKGINFLNSRKLRHKLISENPDFIISAQFFASEVTARLIKKGFIKAKLITVLTDFLPHYVWINNKTHFYCVATREAKESLVKRGVAQERIRVSGIPISPAFLEDEKKDVLREKLGFGRQNFVILIVSGGFGVGPVEKMLRILDKSVLNVEITVICGKNPFLFNRLKEIKVNKKVNIFGFVDNMPQLMKASDLIITKSGGLSSSEALACRLPIIIVRPVPGQESRNCNILIKNKAALKLRSLNDLTAIVEGFIKGEKKEVSAENIKHISHPGAAFKIMEFANSVGSAK
jgi:processive 1,2-diacylglycerol beta-glucosyltransferase